MQRSNRGRASRGSRGRQTEIGVVARVVDRAFDDPAMSGGLFVLTLTVMAIMSNAMFLQPSAHPRPLFPTRAFDDVSRAVTPATGDSATSRRKAISDVEVSVPLPRGRDAAAVIIPTDVVAPPEVRLQPHSPPVITVDPAQQSVVAIQRELARLGLYSGAIDGIPGPRTSAAISSYQAAAGLAVTGDPDIHLLELLTAPVPPAPIGPEITGTTVASVAPDNVAGTVPAPVDSIAELERRNAALIESESYSRIQAALNKIGYGPLSVDGEAGPETVNAIQRFELDNGLDISGSAGDALFERLIAIGALESG